MRIWIEKGFTKTKILPKAENMIFFNTFLIRIWIEKNIRQNQILPKAEKTIFQYFFN